MKRLIFLSMCCMFSLAYSQQSTTGQATDQKSSKSKTTEERPVNVGQGSNQTWLDGKSFLITFLEKKMDKKNTSELDNQKENGSVSKDNFDLKTVDQKGVSQAEKDKTVLTNEDPNTKNIYNSETENTQAGNSLSSQNNSASQDYSQFEKSLDKQKIVMIFKDGKIESTMMSDKKFDSCPYTITSGESNLVTFTSNCKNAESTAKAIWSGFVDENSIKGNFSWVVANGVSYDYSFTGKLTNKKTASVPSTSNEKQNSAYNK
jgi:hypothetical protein